MNYKLIKKQIKSAHIKFHIYDLVIDTTLGRPWPKWSKGDGKITNLQISLLVGRATDIDINLDNVEKGPRIVAKTNIDNIKVESKSVLHKNYFIRANAKFSLKKNTKNPMFGTLGFFAKKVDKNTYVWKKDVQL
jgi:uncharacterized protein involved in tellurium resistance